jgi:hypothetical protein
MSKPSVSIELWSINRWLRYTGFRVFIHFSCAHEPDEPSRIGLQWWGFRDLFFTP